ncbi:MAG: saccharopine dehydrogenase C-terminal domain-containing protein [Gammaproteobacteria bacterium]
MHKILIVGAGKIGCQIAAMMIDSGDYHVTLADLDFTNEGVVRLCKHLPQIETVEIDVVNKEALCSVVRDNDIVAVITCLPYYLNTKVAEAVGECDAHYFDLTEDVSSTDFVKKIAEGKKVAFIPQCGLAPGFINIVAHDLMQRFDQLDSVKLYVGALPQYASNALHYALTWSTDGVINEYGNPCHAIVDGEAIMVLPLEGLELVQLDGCTYEVFNTSGGLGSLMQTYAGKVNHLHYKSMRYPGHCEKMRFLMNDLKLNHDRDTLKTILENALPQKCQDVVIVYALAIGWRDGVLAQETFAKKYYPQAIAGLPWLAIQVTTSAGVCALVDTVLTQAGKYQGWIRQEQFSLQDFLDNRFGRYFLSLE